MDPVAISDFIMSGQFTIWTMRQIFQQAHLNNFLFHFIHTIISCISHQMAITYTNPAPSLFRRPPHLRPAWGNDTTKPRGYGVQRGLSGDQ